ncbi:branched-chain amino acid ABC transporter permease [Halobacteriales archaeon QS_8_69_73]|nr:MAG: branched-chain amino acid ABC transporter permease [Halobacteriales archaeon QS_8_69_73]
MSLRNRTRLLTEELRTAVRLLLEGAPIVVLPVVTVLLLAMPVALPGFHVSLLTETLLFAIFAAAFNLLYGYTGLLSFGHAMFVAAAGYSVAKVFNVVGPMLPFGGVTPLVTLLLAIVVGVAVAGMFAVLIGYLAVQLEEIYFALITLSFSMAIYTLANQDIPGQVLAMSGIGDEGFTNGSDGLAFVPGRMNLFGFEFLLVDLSDPVAFYVLTVFVFVLAIYGLWRIVNSPFGMVCKAIRENPERAKAIGVDVTYHRWVTFVISGLFSGLAGAMLVALGGQVNPQQHAYWTASAEPVVMSVIGGPLSFVGPIVGAFTYEYVRWGISRYPLLEEYWQFSFGVLILVVVLFFENGVAGGLEAAYARLRAWLPVAAKRYRTDGWRGVLAFVGETVAGWLAAARETVRAYAARVRGGVRGYLIRARELVGG